MLEVSGASFEKGRFEIRLEPAGEGNRWIYALAPLRGRLIAISLFLVSGILIYTQAPARFFVGHGWASNSAQAWAWQTWLTWSLVGIGIVCWAAAYLLRRESWTLIFDRGGSKLVLRRASMLSVIPVRESFATFREIDRLQVSGPDREPKSPHGYMEVEVGIWPEPERHTRFRFLSDDQCRIYPLNISKMTGKTPGGDWVDPESLPNS